jgi:hypothetical protein
MVLSHNKCTPYLSATLFRIDREDNALTGQLRRAIAEILKTPGNRVNPPNLVQRRISTPSPSEFTEQDVDIAWFHYSERRPPPWYAETDLKDTLHHLIIIGRKAMLVSISFSDSAARNTVLREIGKATDAPFDRLRRLSPPEIETAFVEDRVRTLWLSGAHRRTVIKADAKVLSGLELESALDPLEDQSYYFSSVRSTSSNPDLASDGRAAVVGASPRHSRVWIGPTRSWDEFVSRIALIIDQAAQKTAERLPDAPPIPILAQPSVGIGGAKQPYDMAILVPELALAGVESNDGEERWLQQFSDAARFEVDPTDDGPNFEADVYWGAEKLGRLSYEFEDRAAGDMRLKVEKKEWNEEPEHHQDLFQICRNPDYLTIYFDTGHTFSRGYFFKTRFRDAQFHDWRWVNMSRDDTKVRQEKPVDGRRFAVQNIGNDDDKSLFGLVARHWPNLEQRGPSAGWLVCDDWCHGIGRLHPFRRHNHPAESDAHPCQRQPLGKRKPRTICIRL